MIPVLAAPVIGIAAAIGAGFTAVIGFFATMMTARVLMVAGAVIAITALSVGLVTALSALAGGLAVVLPEGVTQLAAIMMPSNLSVCISAIVTAHIARWVYDRNVDAIRLLVK